MQTTYTTRRPIESRETHDDGGRSAVMFFLGAVLFLLVIAAIV